MSAKISACTPRFCTIYATSKGKLSIRPSDIPIEEKIIDDASETSFSSTSSSNYTSTSHTGKLLMVTSAILWSRKL